MTKAWKRVLQPAMEFTMNDLGEVRSVVDRAARAAGVSADAAHALVISVSELAANAIRYAGGKGRLTVMETAEDVRVEVSDDGPGLPAGLPEGPPPVDATGGRGLWIVRQLCRDVHVSRSDRGVTVLLRVPRTA